MRGAVVGLLMTLMAWGSTTGSRGVGATGTAVRSDAATPSTTSSPQPSVFFPVMSPAGAVPGALNAGRLVLDKGCLWLDPGAPEQRYLILWPAGSKLIGTGTAVEIMVPGSGERLAIGDDLSAGGGETDAAGMRLYTGDTPPASCQSGAGYWRAYEIKRRSN